MPETWLAWRRDVEDLVRAGPEAAEAALSFFRPRAAELARVPVRAAKKIAEKALRRQEGRGLPLVVVRGDGEVHARAGPRCRGAAVPRVRDGVRAVWRGRSRGDRPSGRVRVGGGRRRGRHPGSDPLRRRRAR